MFVFIFIFIFALLLLLLLLDEGVFVGVVVVSTGIVFVALEIDTRALRHTSAIVDD